MGLDCQESRCLNHNRFGEALLCRHLWDTATFCELHACCKSSSLGGAVGGCLPASISTLLRCVAPDEAGVQAARAKAAASGIPSSEPMTLSEMEAVQAKMDAKKGPQSNNLRSSRFSAGESFLFPATSAIPSVPSSSAQLASQSHQAVQAASTAPTELRVTSNDLQATGQQAGQAAEDATASMSNPAEDQASLQHHIDHDASVEHRGGPVAEADLEEGQLAAFRVCLPSCAQRLR